MARTIDLDIELPVIVTPSAPQVQADWNQNDSEAVDYINNRTHYEVTTGREYHNQSEGYETVTMYMSTLEKYAAITLDSLTGRTLTVTMYGDTSTLDTSDYIMAEEGVYLVGEEGMCILLTMPNQETGLDEGLYFLSSIEGYAVEYNLTAKDEIHQLDEKFIPDTIARTSDIPTQVQADWNQNDSSAKDYIKNRICSITQGEIVYCDTTVPSNASLVYYFNPPQDMLSGTYSIKVAGETVTLTMSGNQSSTSGNYSLSQGGGGCSWNKSGISGAPSGETAVLSMSANPSVYGNANIKVYGQGEAYNTIDDRFISSNIARTSDIPSAASNVLDGSNVGSVKTSGVSTGSQGDYAFCCGFMTYATGANSFAEGQGGGSAGNSAHKEGVGASADGTAAHAEGGYTQATGDLSHAEGDNTRANHKSQHVFGENNIADTSAAASTARGTYVEIVGNGTSNNARSNARTLDWSGNEQIAGTLRIGSTSTGGVLLKEDNGSLKISFDNGTTWLTVQAS